MRTTVEFHKNDSRKDGLSETCKVCAIERVRVWCQKNKERVRAYRKQEDVREKSRLRSAAWYHAHRDEVLKVERAKRRADPEKVRAADRARSKTPRYKETRRKYRATKPVKLKVAKRAFYERNKKAIRVQQQEYSRKNRAKIMERQRRWALAQPTKARDVKRRYEDRKRAAAAHVLATLTATQWVAILALYDNRCAYCGDSGRLEREHKLPLSRGGDTSAENIVPACRSCNASKHAKTPAEWLLN